MFIHIIFPNNTETANQSEQNLSQIKHLNKDYTK